MPLVYISQEVYEEVFGELLKLNPRLNPTDFMTDFERATMNTIRKFFPAAEVHGCHFHFCQNIWAHVQQFGLQTRYTDDEDFALNIRMLIALAFLPSHHVIDAFEKLMDTEFYKDNAESDMNDEIQNLVTYFEATYVGAFNRVGKRKNALYPVAIWNMYDIVLQGNTFYLHYLCFVTNLDVFINIGSPKTNNQVEGWHNKLRQFVGIHPNIFHFIKEMKTEQHEQEIILAQIEAGAEPPPRRKLYIKSEARLLKVVEEFDDVFQDGDFLPYLKKVAHNASL